jgi:hypothetical protein
MTITLEDDRHGKTIITMVVHVIMHIAIASASTLQSLKVTEPFTGAAGLT